MSETAPEPQPQRDMPEGRRFQPGQSGNPKGRPKGLARKVRELAGDNDGETIARFWLAGMSGQLPNPEYLDASGNPVTGQKQYLVVDPKDRILCSRLLAERGWGKPPMFAPIEDDDPLDFAEKEAEEIAASLDARMDELAEKRREREERDQAADTG